MGAAEKKEDCTFTALGFRGPYKSMLISVKLGESVDGAANDFITLDDHELACTTIVSVRAFIFATGESTQYSYATNVLTKETADDTRDVIEVIYK